MSWMRNVIIYVGMEMGTLKDFFSKPHQMDVVFVVVRVIRPTNLYGA